MIFLGLVGAVGLFILMGRAVDLPEWVVTRVEAVLEERFPNIDMGLDGVSVVVEDKLRPRVTLHNVRLTHAESNSAIAVERIDASFSLDNLGDGRINPTDLRLSGLSFALQRREDGSFDLAFGGQGQGLQGLDPETVMAGFGTQIEALLARPFFAQLDRVSIDALSLRYEDLRAGLAWNVDGASARMERDEALISFGAHLTLLGGRGYASSVDLALETAYGTEEAHFILAFDAFPAGEIAAQSAALAWLGAVRAPISGALRVSVDPQGRLGPTTVSLEMDKGVLHPEGVDQPIPFQSALTHLTYRPKQQRITLDRLAVRSDWVTLTARGQAVLGDFQQGLPQETVFQLSLRDLQVAPTRQSAVEVALDSAFADFRLRLDPFEVSLGQLVLNQSDRQLTLAGDLSVAEGEWVFQLAGDLNHYNRDDLVAIWPEGVKPRLQKWIRDNLFSGDFRDISFRMKSRPDDKPEVFLNFLFSDADIRFMKTLPPVRRVTGFATMIHEKFHVTAEQGWITPDQGGEINVAGTAFTVENTRLKQSPATVQLKAQGAVTGFLSLLNRPPLEVMTKANLPVDLASGGMQAEGVVQLVLKPKVTPEEVTFTASGHGRDIRTSHFIKGKEMGGDVSFSATEDKVVIDVDGQVGALPGKVRWQTGIGARADGTSTLTGQSELSPLALEEFAVGLPPGTVQGSAPADLRIEFVTDVPPVMTLTSDLVGATLDIPPLAWRKLSETEGQAAMQITLTSPPTIDGFDLTAPGLDAEGSLTLTAEGGLGQVDFTAFRVGNWLQGQGRLIGRGPGRTPAVEMRGGTFDMRNLPEGLGGGGSGGGGGGDPIPITANLSEARVSETIFLTDVTGNFTTSDGLVGNFSGNLNGSAPIRGEVYPQNTGTGVHVVSDNAARVLMAMRLLDAATGGTLSLRLAPNPDGQNWDGSFQVLGLKVQELPVVAEMLNAVSVVGLLEQLQGPGILFNEISGRFQLSDTRLVIGQSSAVGPAMGVSADGYYRLADSFLDMQGALSPLFVVNQMGRVISKKGEGLIAFNYQVRGPIDNYSITVNPLSALTPGFFREIFRRPPPSMEGNTLSVPQSQPTPTDPGQSGQGPDNR
ncbi:AsmA-like C-terminal region-containing protein [Shimia sp. SDUM112013]|uniref:YhdP family protein n=1 Tax=Shimia sp. SDUM112013 TaxID=3136160 RepID=UPI0032ED606D